VIGAAKELNALFASVFWHAVPVASIPRLSSGVYLGHARARIVPGILPLHRAPLARAKRRNASMHRAGAAGILSSLGRGRNNKP
jgi:hypothetical protein